MTTFKLACILEITIEHMKTQVKTLWYACSIPGREKCAFLTVLGAVCCSVWKTRNEVIFQNHNICSTRNLIILICTIGQICSKET
jgi:hypothetical protein